MVVAVVSIARGHGASYPAPLQERVVTHTQNSHRRQRGWRRAENSRIRKNARPWRSAVLLGAGLRQLPQTQLHAGGWRLDGRSG